ncbi:hypothetical protein BD414DRAFT_389562, partial [Trametes punicea]
MPSRSKKQSLTIVVRPIVPGTRDVTKVVLGNLAELNRHAPLVSPLLALAPSLPCRPLPAVGKLPPLSALGLTAYSGSELTTFPC